MSAKQLLEDEDALNQALAGCTESVQLRRELADAAFLLIQKARYEEAVRLFDAVIDLDDLELTSYCNALWVVQKDNTKLPVDERRARRYLAASLPHGPRNPAIHLNAAAVYAELSQPDDAIAQLLEAAQQRFDIRPFLTEPLFAPLTTHARWPEVVAAAGGKQPQPRPAPMAVPEYARFFNEEEYATFRALMAAHLKTELVPFFEKRLDDGVIAVELDINRAKNLDVKFLAERCHALPRDQWPVQIAEYLRVLSGPPARVVDVPEPIVRHQEGSAEPQMEALLTAIIPGLADAWQGVSAGEIDALEAEVGRPLPRFYRWFLSKMGRSVGPLGYGRTDFSVEAIRPQIEAGSPHLLIGAHEEDIMPLDTIYDLDQPARDDALIYCPSGGPRFETFREMLAWSALYHSLAQLPQRCEGIVRGELEPLHAAMEKLGFTQPIATGACCGLWERRDAVMVCSRTPRDDGSIFIFNLGGGDAGLLKGLLGQIMSSVNLELSCWKPALG